MKRLTSILPFVVCGVGAWILVSTLIEYRGSKREDTVAGNAKALSAAPPESAHYAEQDQRLVEQVFDNPKILDSLQSKASSITAVDGIAISEMAMGISTNTPTEWEVPKTLSVSSSEIASFSSLRADAVRNPESEQNQATARSIMKMRQRRVTRLGLD